MINVCEPEQRTYTTAVPCHHEGCNPSKQKDYQYCQNFAFICGRKRINKHIHQNNMVGTGINKVPG
jgi:hypothetical protein